MPSTAIWFGRILVLIGVVGYAYGLYGTSGPASPTALIPAAFGLILMVCGHVAAARDNLRKMMMHIAVVIGLLGFLAALGGVFRKGMPEQLGPGVVSGIAMAIVCFAFVVLCVRSFIAARQASN